MVKGARDGQEFSGHIPLVKALGPAITAVQHQPGDVLENTIRRNVMINVQKLKSTGPILGKAVANGSLKVAGEIYSVETGRVRLIT